MSCAPGGYCAAGGYYTDGSRHHAGVRGDPAKGRWRAAVEVPGSAVREPAGTPGHLGVVPGGGRLRRRRVYSDLGAFVVSQARASGAARGGARPGGPARRCRGQLGVVLVGGQLRRGRVPSGGGQAFVVSEQNGVWGTAEEVPGTAALNRRGRRGRLGVVRAGRLLRRWRVLVAAPSVTSGPIVFVATGSNGIWSTAVAWHGPDWRPIPVRQHRRCRARRRAAAPRPGTTAPATREPRSVRGEPEERRLGRA